MQTRRMEQDAQWSKQKEECLTKKDCEEDKYIEKDWPTYQSSQGNDFHASYSR